MEYNGRCIHTITSHMVIHSRRTRDIGVPTTNVLSYYPLSVPKTPLPGYLIKLKKEEERFHLIHKTSLTILNYIIMFKGTKVFSKARKGTKVF